jgi:hypothetical protein
MNDDYKFATVIAIIIFFPIFFLIFMFSGVKRFFVCLIWLAVAAYLTGGYICRWEQECKNPREWQSYEDRQRELKEKFEKMGVDTGEGGYWKSTGSSTRGYRDMQ